MLIRPILSARILAGLMATASLVACANPPGSQDHGRHHAGQPAHTMAPGSSSASPAQGGTMGGHMMDSHAGCGGAGTPMSAGAGCGQAGAGGMQHMDKEAMCSMYRSMRDAPTEQAQQAMMERNMQGMSPGMRQQHMEMMRQQCQ